MCASVCVVFFVFVCVCMCIDAYVRQLSHTVAVQSVCACVFTNVGFVCVCVCICVHECVCMRVLASPKAAEESTHHIIQDVFPLKRPLPY